MLHSAKYSLLSVVLILVINFVLSIFFGNEGVEAFYAVYIMTGLAFTMYTFRLGQDMFRKHIWLIVKIFIVACMLAAWLNIATVVALPILEPDINPGIDVPEIDWLLVGILVIGLLLQRIIYRNRDRKNTTEIAVGIAASVLSIVVLFVGFLNYFGNESPLRALTLLFATNTVYLANYIYSETRFITNTHAWLNRRMNTNTDTGMFFLFFVIAAPFVLPLIVLLVL